jgi:hypothetical protein
LIPWCLVGSTHDPNQERSGTRPFNHKYLRKGPTCPNTKHIQVHIGTSPESLCAETTFFVYCSVYCCTAIAVHCLRVHLGILLWSYFNVSLQTLHCTPLVIFYSVLLLLPWLSCKHKTDLAITPFTIPLIHPFLTPCLSLFILLSVSVELCGVYSYFVTFYEFRWHVLCCCLFCGGGGGGGGILYPPVAVHDSCPHL